MKILDNYRDLYELNDSFQIVNIGNGPGRTVGKILKPFLGRGYPRVRLSRGQTVKNFSVHRIIAEEKIPNPLNLPQVNHKNGIKTDYTVENLEWVSAKDNMHHSWTNGLQKSWLCKGSDHRNSKPVLDMNTGIFYDSLNEAAHYRGIRAGYVANLIFKGKNKTGLVYV